MARPRRGPARPAFALLGRSAADLFHCQGVDPPLRLIARYASQTAVHHVPNAVNGYGSFGDIGSDNDLSVRIRGKGAVLVFRRQFAVQRDESEALIRARHPEGIDGGV